MRVDIQVSALAISEAILVWSSPFNVEVVVNTVRESYVTAL
jgi:hypothetical protein